LKARSNSAGKRYHGNAQNKFRAIKITKEEMIIAVQDQQR